MAITIGNKCQPIDRSIKKLKPVYANVTLYIPFTCMKGINSRAIMWHTRVATLSGNLDV